MPTFSQSLEQSLHRALAIANERHHQYATLEHLLLSLVDDSDAAAVMRACSVDLDKLRTSLVNYLETEFENLVTDGSDDAKPTAGFQRVIQRAVILCRQGLDGVARKSGIRRGIPGHHQSRSIQGALYGRVGGAGTGIVDRGADHGQERNKGNGKNHGNIALIGAGKPLRCAAHRI